jgi:hypothetical protein
MTSTELILPSSKELYQEDIGIGPIVTGNVSERAKTIVRRTYMRAKEKVLPFLGKYGLIRRSSRRYAPVVVKRMEAGKNGITNAFTDGKRIGVNEYIVPETNTFYKLAKRLKNSRNSFAKYLYSKLSKPISNLMKSILHEDLHRLTQFDTKFLDYLYTATERYFSSRLPKYMKPLAQVLACKVFVPLAEGLNEGMTYQAFYDLKNNSEIKKLAAKEPTSYGLFTQISTDAVGMMGKRSPADFYKSYMQEGYRNVVKYVTNFFNAARRYIKPQKSRRVYARA